MDNNFKETVSLIIESHVYKSNRCYYHEASPDSQSEYVSQPTYLYFFYSFLT